MKFKTIAAVLLLAVSAPAFAQDCDIPDQPGLSKEAMAALRVSCEQAILDSTKGPSIDVGNLKDPQALSEWGIVAQEWAKALGIAAKELGIAVDEFLGTDAGKLTAFIILWQVMGESFLGLIIGIPLLIVIMTVGIRTARRAKIQTITYSETKKTLFGRPAIDSITYFREDQTFMYWIAHIATIILSIMTISLVIF